MLKKIGLYLLGAFTTLIGVVAGVWVTLKSAPPTTEISGKIKVKNGTANLDIKHTGEEPRQKKKKLKTKKQKNERIFSKSRRDSRRSRRMVRSDEGR